MSFFNAPYLPSEDESYSFCRVADKWCSGSTPIGAVDIRGLVKVVPKHGAGDKAFHYCINGFTIDHYSDLLTQRQHRYPTLCRTSIFVKTPQLVSAYVGNDF